MRYFRFYSRLSRNGADHDLGTLRAIEEHGGGLAGISGERIWAEMSKIIDQKFNYEFFDLAYRLKIDQFIGLPKCDFCSKATEYKLISQVIFFNVNFYEKRKAKNTFLAKIQKIF